MIRKKLSSINSKAKKDKGQYCNTDTQLIVFSTNLKKDLTNIQLIQFKWIKQNLTFRQKNFNDFEIMIVDRVFS